MRIILGIVALTYWVFFWIFQLFDMYPEQGNFEITMRVLSPVAVLINVVGIVLEIIKLKDKNKKWLLISLRFALHFLPLLAIGGFYYWLAFGHLM
jgi:hypothetical protein